MKKTARFLAIIALFCSWAGFAARAETPELQILHVPREDLSRAPGYTDAGLFLPLSELMALAREAGITQEKPESGPVTCVSLHLSGTVKDALRLEGKLEFDAPWEGWNAVLVNDAALSWTAQSATGASGSASAFLARVNERIFLFAKGPAKGEIALSAFVPVRFEEQEATLSFGRFHAPCQLNLTLDEKWAFLDSTAPAESRSPLLRIWPTQKDPATIRLRRKISMDAPPVLTAELTRIVQASGAGMEVADTLTLHGRFSPEATFWISLPSGLRLLRVEGRENMRIAPGPESLALTPLEKTETMQVYAVFAAALEDETAMLGDWQFSAESRRARLTFRASPQYAPFLKTRSEQIIPLRATAAERRYDSWGPLPELEVAFVSLKTPAPPEIAAAIEIKRNEAVARYTARFPDTRRHEMLFSIPDEWVLMSVEVQKTSGETSASSSAPPLPSARPVAAQQSASYQIETAAPPAASRTAGPQPQGSVAAGPAAPSFTIQQQTSGRWRIAWDPAEPVGQVAFVLRRMGAWGAPGQSVPLPIPVVRFDGPRPSRYELQISSPEELEVRSVSLNALSIQPDDTAAPPPQAPTTRSSSSQLVLIATGAEPSGILSILGRESDTRATVVTALSLAEDRAIVRALIAYEVRFAPANTFRFLLPAGTGSNIRIEGEGIRERHFAPSPEGEIWTLVTQEAVLGAFPVTLQWPLRVQPEKEAVAVPEIRLPGVASQRGFLILEASETLRLTAETRNLAEADPIEIPEVPWARDSRILATYRYITPPFLLRVQSEKFQTEPPLEAIIREGQIHTALAPNGERFTRARYTVTPTRDRQFFEIRLPFGAIIWSALVNGEGVKPARRPDEAGNAVYLIPLPAASSAAEYNVTVLYREMARGPLAKSRRVELLGPELSAPVNRTIWSLSLPPGFEYLSFGGSFGKTIATHEPAARFFRAAHYPNRIVFMEMPFPVILILTIVGTAVFFALRNPRKLYDKLKRPIPFGSPSASGTPPADAKRKLAATFILWLFVVPVLIGVSVLSRVAGQIFFILLILFLIVKVGATSFKRAAAQRAKSGEALDEPLWTAPQPAETPPPPPEFVPPPPPPVEHPRHGCTGGCLSLLIVLFVIAVLAIIAVPNFLEAQIRSKVSRAQTDMRSIATAIEAYMVDNNQYPHDVRILSQGPVNYISSLLMDPYSQTYSSGGAAGYRYIAGPEAVEKAKKLGYLSPDAPPSWGYWLLYSVGPDGRDDGAEILYDPTNGSTSAGDLVRFSATTFDRRYRQVRDAEQADLSSALEMPAQPPVGDKARKSLPAPASMPTDGVLVEVGEEMPAARFTGTPKSVRPPPAPDRPGTVSGDKPGLPGKPKEDGYEAEAERMAGAARARAQGLLSLDVEIPEGGIQREFAALGGKARLEIRLMEEHRFLRLRFIIWAIAFLMMLVVWVRKRNRFQAALGVGAAVTLLPPVLIEGLWAPFFNAALEGILFSLLLPLGAVLLKRFGYLPEARQVSRLFLLVVLGAGLAGNALLSAAPPKDDAVPTLTPAHMPAISAASLVQNNAIPTLAPARETAPLQVLIPYEADTVRMDAVSPLPRNADPLAFISKEDFARLWNIARRETKPGQPPASILAEISIRGDLIEKESLMRCDFFVRAANPADAPASITLGIANLIPDTWSAEPPGAILQPGPDGLVLLLPPNWGGMISARGDLPCRTRGASGNLRIQFPETGSGLWSFIFPDPRTIPAGASAAWCVREATPSNTIRLAGPVRPGPMDLSWTTESQATPVRPAAPREWRADITAQVRWTDLAAANWSARIRLAAAHPDQSLPAEIRLAIPPNLHLLKAVGEHLLGTTVQTTASSPHETPRKDSVVVVRLDRVAAADITLEGLLAAPEDGEDPWTVPVLRVPDGISARTNLRLDIGDAIEILAINTRNLERRPVRDALSGYATQAYESEGDSWEARAQLRRRRADFSARITDFFAPLDGFLLRAGAVSLTPQGAPLSECVFFLPAGTQVQTLQGKGIVGWMQSGRSVAVAFDPPVQNPADFTLTAVSDLETASDLETGRLTLVPLDLEGAGETKRTLAVFVSVDNRLAETDLAQGKPQSPGSSEKELQILCLSQKARISGSLHSYALVSNAPLQFAFRAVEGSSRDTVFNQVTISEGLESLDCVVRALPRQGRFRQIDVLLLLPEPDPGAPARLQTTGPVRHVQITPISDRVLRVSAELTAPHTRTVQVRFQLDRPVPAEHGSTLPVTVMVPVNQAGARAFLLLRRAIEGELNLADASDARSVDASKVDWPAGAFRILPSDEALELSVLSDIGPSFTIVRYTRVEALRAVVDVLRQRTILTEDGLERHEVEIVLQNQSEQFLKIALPYPKKQITFYEIQVAGRRVKAAFSVEQGREVLLVPLIRTGLLEPEFTVRLAWTASGRPPLAGKGRRAQKLPEILGGIPIAQSALVLMLPGNFRYSDFRGSLRQVEQVDLEIDETLRTARRVEQLTEAIKISDEAIQQKAMDTLGVLQKEVEMKVQIAQQLNVAQQRQAGSYGLGREVLSSEKKLQDERMLNIKEAKIALRNIGATNLALFQSREAERAQAVEQAADILPPVEAVVPPVQFPRAGNVFAFRRLQGTGEASFHYVSLEKTGRRNDILLALILVSGAVLLALTGRAVFATLRRAALFCFALSVLAIIFQVALDVAFPLVAASLIILFRKSGR